MRISILLLGCCLPILSFCQVVNTEKLRANGKTEGWVSDINFNIGLNRNKAGQTLTVGSTARIERLGEKDKWLLFGGYNLSQFTDVDDSEAVPKNFTNKAYGHFRYNYNISPLITWEAFSQIQFDEIQEVDIRVLNGMGPRLRIMESDSATLYWGILYMYEYEETSDLPEVITYNRDHRASTYLSAGYALKSYLVIDHVSYFQPNLTDFSDYRITSETTINVKVTEKLSFQTFFQIIYDEEPPTTVPNTMFSFTNGFTLTL